ncbi:MAG: hypothetical protein LAO06_00245 [Acidobacteriia bacterium]|nr:hypothetical protein [Terriglobia bacterium]
MKLWDKSEPYRAGDRVFAILQHPEVALLLTCEAPSCWTAIVFDFARKQAVASTQNQPSCTAAQQYVLTQTEALYKVAPPATEIQWQQALNRPDILQT